MWPRLSTQTRACRTSAGCVTFMRMRKPVCPACGRAIGSNAECLSCREAAAKELAREAEDITPPLVSERASAVERFLNRQPWYARVGRAGFYERVRLLRMILKDYWKGDYREVPVKAVSVIGAAVAYALSPADLIPDWLIPAGSLDDVLVVGLACALVKRELRDYCAFRKLSPEHFGL